MPTRLWSIPAVSLNPPSMNPWTRFWHSPYTKRPGTAGGSLSPDACRSGSAKKSQRPSPRSIFSWAPVPMIKSRMRSPAGLKPAPVCCRRRHPGPCPHGRPAEIRPPIRWPILKSVTAATGTAPTASSPNCGVGCEAGRQRIFLPKQRIWPPRDLTKSSSSRRIRPHMDWI